MNAAGGNESVYTVQRHFPKLRHQRGMIEGRSHATVQMSVLPSPGMSSYILYVVLLTNHISLSKNCDGIDANEGNNAYLHIPNTELSTITFDDVQNNYPYSVVTFIGIEPVIRVVDAYSPQCNRA